MTQKNKRQGHPVDWDTATLLKEILFDFIKEMPEGIVKDTLTLKKLNELIDDFIEAHVNNKQACCAGKKK